MTDQQILTKAIQKAIDGGWHGELADNIKLIADEDIELLTQAWRNVHHLAPINFIFNHDFAKALWGEELLKCQMIEPFALPAWKCHLRSMVIVDDPIKYLGEHL